MHDKTLDLAVSACRLMAAAVILVAGIVGPRVVHAQPYGLGNFDARPSVASPAVATASISGQMEQVGLLRQQVPDLVTSFDVRTGVTRSLSSSVGYLSAQQTGAPADLAIEWILARTELLGLTDADLQDYEVRSVRENSATGSSHVYLRQTVDGLPLYNGQLQVNVNRDGRVLGVNNAFLRDLRGAINTTQPSLTALQAVDRAAEQIEIATDPDAVATARLMLLAIERGEARLVWNLQLATPDAEHHFDFTVDALTGAIWTRVDWVNSERRRRSDRPQRGRGRVMRRSPATTGAEAAASLSPQITAYPVPIESPHHTSPLPPSDGRIVVVNPANAIASPLGWHDTGASSYTIMRGNNVHAYEDSNADDQPPAVEPDCGADLHCDFPIDLAAAPSTYRPASVANLFYWNNIIHDIQYQYGFDEAAGNFQVNNFANGGLGNDHVRAEAQDGSGSCNANIFVPPDGVPPQMQMFTCDIASPARDGALDNGVIVHEYGHGISIRTVGGPSNASCLGNTQQMGEGFSDLLFLMYTAEVGDAGTDPRPGGTWLLGQSASGPGTRPAPYSTDTGVNGFSYADIGSQAVPHGVGFVWATIAWEAYWELVNIHGFDPDLYNATGGSGNQRMMLYVQEGMANTACSPSFLDARDGIIQAAADNYGGEDVCALWEAFARRGLGVDATTGGPNTLAATNGFDSPVICFLESAGIVSLDPDPLFCGFTLNLLAADLDLQGSGTLSVELISSSGDSEAVQLAESPPGVFEGSVATLEASAIVGNNILEVSDGDLLTLTYHDADNGSGNPAVVTASVSADCSENLGFEFGSFATWVPEDLSNPFFPLQVAGFGVSPGFGFFSSAPTEGSFAAVHGFDGGGPGTIKLGIDLSLAQAASRIFFDYRAAWDLLTYGARIDRTFSVVIEPAGGGAALQSDVILVAEAGTVELDTGDMTGSVDVVAFSGQNIRLSFEWDVPENFSGPAFFQLDTIEVEEEAIDSDGDGFFDGADNCVDTPNPDQCDSNLDGLGNLCDPDTTNDGAVGVPDENDLRSSFLQVCPYPWGPCADADFTCDGVVDDSDFNVLENYFGGPPGQSGLHCAGTVPCPASACSHGVFIEGDPLHPVCDPCAEVVCAANPACCISGWDSGCVEQAISVCGIANDTQLFGSDPQSGMLLIIDANTGQASSIGAINSAGKVTEIEWSPDGQTLYATTGGGSSSLLTIDPDTGAVLSQVTHQFGALNGLEFDQSGNLLGTFISGPGSNSVFVIVDVTTGAMTTIGPTGFQQIGGLAFNPNFTTLFGITSGSSGTPNLLSIDPQTGNASAIAAVDVPVEFSSLEMTPNGRLIAGASDGNLYELDPSTGASTLIGPTGQSKLSGLSFRP